MCLRITHVRRRRKVIEEKEILIGTRIHAHAHTTMHTSRYRWYTTKLNTLTLDGDLFTTQRIWTGVLLAHHGPSAQTKLMTLVLAVELANGLLRPQHTVGADHQQRLVADHTDVRRQRPRGHAFLLDLYNACEKFFFNRKNDVFSGVLQYTYVRTCASTYLIFFVTSSFSPIDAQNVGTFW